MEAKPVFKPKILLVAVFLSHFVTWALWSFVIMDGVKPFIDTFSDEDGRLGYIAFLMCVLFCSGPFVFPFETKK